MKRHLAFALVYVVAVCHVSVGQQADSKSTQSLDELLLFFPSKHPEGNWEPKNLDYEDIHFDAKDGTRLHA